MSRTKLDNIEIDDIHCISDINALARTNYTGSLRIAKLYALLSIASQIQLRLSQTVPERSAIAKDSNYASELRTMRIANNIIEMHLTAIKKRIAQVEAINARKASKLRRERTILELADRIGDAGAMARITNLAPKPGLPSITPELRARIAAPIIADLHTPSVDESHSNMMSNIEALERERVTQLTPELKVIDTGDKLGSAEDWLK